MLDLADLHDAILESIAIQVAAGVVTFVLMPVQFEGAAKRITLHARQWKMLVCPKQEPWGHAAECRLTRSVAPPCSNEACSTLNLKCRQAI